MGTRLMWPTIQEVELEGGQDAYIVHGVENGWWCYPAAVEGGLVQRDRRRGRLGVFDVIYEWAILAPSGRGGEWRGIVGRLTEAGFDCIRKMAEIGEDPERRRLLEAFPVDQVRELPSVALVGLDVREVGLRAGDLLVETGVARDRLPPVAETWDLSRPDLAALRAADREAEGEAVEEITPWNGGGVAAILHDARRWGRPTSNWRPKLRALRLPIRRGPEAVTAPVVARSDRAAIFELLWQVERGTHPGAGGIR